MREGFKGRVNDKRVAWLISEGSGRERKLESLEMTTEHLNRKHSLKGPRRGANEEPLLLDEVLRSRTTKPST